MSEDEAPSSPDSDILYSNAFEDVDEDSVKINLDLLRHTSGEFEPPSKKARKKSNNEEKKTTPKKDSSPKVPENENDVSSRAVSDILVIPDSPENFTIPDSPENFSISRKGHQTARQARVSPRRTRSSMRTALLNTISVPDTIVIDELSSPISPSPVKRNGDSVFNESLSLLSGDEVLEESSSAPQDSVNREVTVRVIWKGGDIHHFSIRKFQKLKEIFTFFAKKESVPEDRIMLVVRDRHLTPDDSPHSIGTLSFIEGGIIDHRDSKSSAIQSSAPIDANSLELKVQQKGVKEKLIVHIARTDKMAIFMSKVAEELDLPLSRMKFVFDGETLDPNETPGTLDLDGGECIELTVKQ